MSRCVFCTQTCVRWCLGRYGASYSRFHLPTLQMVFISGVVLNGLMRSLVMALAGEGGPAGAAQWAECRAVRSPGKDQEKLPGGSHVRAESSRMSRVSQTVREGGKGGGPEGDSDSCRGLEASGNLDI